MSTECRTKDSQGKSSWVHPQESGPEVIQGLGGVTTFPTLLGLVLGVNPAKLSEIAVDREVFQVLLGLLPRDPP